MADEKHKKRLDALVAEDRSRKLIEQERVDMERNRRVEERQQRQRQVQKMAMPLHRGSP